MYVALALVRLCHEQIGHMSSNSIFIAHCVTSKDLLQAIGNQSRLLIDRITTHIRAFSKARSQLCLLIIEIISGAALPASFRRPTWVAARIP